MHLDPYPTIMTTLAAVIAVSFLLLAVLEHKPWKRRTAPRRTAGLDRPGQGRREGDAAAHACRDGDEPSAGRPEPAR